MKEKVDIEICVGTTCHIMGGAELQNLANHIPDILSDKVTICGTPCLGACRDGNYGNAPFVRINGKIISQATITDIIRELNNELEI